MDRKMMYDNQEAEIDLPRLLNALCNNALRIGIAALICAAVTFLGTCVFATPQYQSAVMFYVNNNSAFQEAASLSVSSGDITASRSLAKSYIVILNTRQTLTDVIDHAGVEYTYIQLQDMISAELVDATEIIRVVVTSPDPQEAKLIADAIADILPKRISGIMEGTSAKLVDSAIVPASASSPDYIRNTVAGFAIGLILATVWLVLGVLTDITIRTEDDMIRRGMPPILAAVPDMKVRRVCGKIRGNTGARAEPVGDNISFAAVEGYRLLRTKLQFTFPETGACCVIGVSSALTGEGKSLTAANLACSMSRLGKRVLLMDCDMRRPSLADKLCLRQTPGLADFLSGQVQASKLLQPYGVEDGERGFHVIAAGSTPCNPTELLSADRMTRMIGLLRQRYDCIVLDLPSVGVVGDALAVAGLTDGMLLVVRQNYCDRTALDFAVQQLAFVDAKILGIVFNGVVQDGRYEKTYGWRHCRKNDKKTAAFPKSQESVMKR